MTGRLAYDRQELHPKGRRLDQAERDAHRRAMTVGSHSPPFLHALPKYEVYIWSGAAESIRRRAGRVAWAIGGAAVAGE